MKKIVLSSFVAFMFLSAIFFTKVSVSSFETTVYVDPSTNDVSVGNTFAINVSLADDVWLQQFEFYLGYNTSILDGLDAWVYSPYKTPVEPQINDTEGYVHVFAVHEGPIPSALSVSESLTLASITFKATAVGSSYLDLYGIILIGGLGTWINYTTVNGSVTVQSGIITVPDDYLTIQEAINHADEGDTIFVRAGTYYENVVVNKSLSLIGENRNTTIIDGSRNGTVIFVTANHVSINGLTIQNGYYIPHITYGIKVGGWQDGCNNVAVHGNIISDNDIGIFVYYSSNCVIFDNEIFNNFRGIDIVLSNDNQIKGNSLFSNGEGVVVGSDANSNMIRDNEIYNNDFGIHVGWSRDNNIVGNKITLNAYAGIRFDSSTNNSIIGNTITLSNRDGIVLFGSDSNIITRNELTQNKWDGMAVWYSQANIIYHNNFRDNMKQAGSYSGSITSWDNGYPSGGNYWNNYVGADVKSGPYQNETGSDGIGDTPYVIDGNNQDNYPLMGMFSDFNATSEYPVQTICNSTISDFQFNGATICFNVTGEQGTTGFCRICIPRTLMNETYRVFVNGTEFPYSLLPCSNSTHNYLYFTYHHSTQEVIIITEFPTWTSMLLTLIMVTVAISIYKRRKLKTPNH